MRRDTRVLFFRGEDERDGKLHWPRFHERTREYARNSRPDLFRKKNGFSPPSSWNACESRAETIGEIVSAQDTFRKRDHYLLGACAWTKRNRE